MRGEMEEAERKGSLVEFLSMKLFLPLHLCRFGFKSQNSSSLNKKVFISLEIQGPGSHQEPRLLLAHRIVLCLWSSPSRSERTAGTPAITDLQEGKPLPPGSTAAESRLSSNISL